MASNSEEEFRRDCGASDGECGGGASDGERGGGASGGEAAAPPYECVEGALEYAYVKAVDFDQKQLKNFQWRLLYGPTCARSLAKLGKCFPFLLH